MLIDSLLDIFTQRIVVQSRELIRERRQTKLLRYIDIYFPLYQGHAIYVLKVMEQ